MAYLRKDLNQIAKMIHIKNYSKMKIDDLKKSIIKYMDDLEIYENNGNVRMAECSTFCYYTGSFVLDQFKSDAKITRFDENTEFKDMKDEILTEESKYVTNTYYLSEGYEYRKPYIDLIKFYIDYKKMSDPVFMIGKDGICLITSGDVTFSLVPRYEVNEDDSFIQF